MARFPKCFVCKIEFIDYYFVHVIDRCRLLPTRNGYHASKPYALPSLTLDLCRKFWPEHRRTRHAVPKSIRKVDTIICMRRPFHANTCRPSVMAIHRIKLLESNQMSRRLLFLFRNSYKILFLRAIRESDLFVFCLFCLH